MKKLFVFIVCATLVILVLFNAIHINEKRRISNHISNYIVANIQQLSNSYENMYSAEGTSKYFDSSLLYAIDICDKIEEEIVFYNAIYPKRDMFLGDIVDDYKLLMRSMKNNPSLIKEAQPLHYQLQQYILNYVSDGIDYNDNPTKALYETDKKAKMNDDGNWHLLHDKVVKLSKK